LIVRLKNLYKYLIENRKHEVKGWHDAYRKFYTQVGEVCERINAGERLSKNDKVFLKHLLFEQSNGVSSRGQSTLSKENFEKVIQDSRFLEYLQSLILDPTPETYKAFSGIWKEKVAKNNPVLINRVAAASTLEVSTTVDSGKFNQVFSWLIRDGIIPKYEGKDDWFSKNEWLIKQIKSTDWLEQKEGDENGFKVYKVKASDPEIETDEFYLSQFVWELYENMLSPFSLKKQIIKYGAPGTGKTYQARQQTSLLFDIWKEEFAPNSGLTHASQIELVQFHPSFSYEDFIEGLRPELVNGTVQLTLQNGVFKEFCKKAGKWEIDYHNLSNKPQQDGKYIAFEDLRISDIKNHADLKEKDNWKHLLDTGEDKLVSAAIPPFFFIIDEINRAELSRVFGELMYCLEYRGVKGCIKTQYTNLNNEETGMLKIGQDYQFFIPTNIYLIGTMNTIDRSVESFDFALRRRFRWEEVSPDMSVLKYDLNKNWEDLSKNLENLNTEIAKEPLLGKDYQIGHAYLMNLKYAPSLTVAEVRKLIWDDNIQPLLQEYLRGTGKESKLIGSQEKAGTFKQAFGIK